MKINNNPDVPVNDSPLRPTLRPATTAAEAIDAAVDWQHWVGEQNLSYGELSDWQTYFEDLAARFPEVADEFRENGII